jgi:hypothetical protein
MRIFSQMQLQRGVDLTNNSNHVAKHMSKTLRMSKVGKREGADISSPPSKQTKEFQLICFWCQESTMARRGDGDDAK